MPARPKDTKGKPKPAPPPPVDVTVKDCLVWQQPANENKNKKDGSKTQSSGKKNQVTGGQNGCRSAGQETKQVSFNYTGMQEPSEPPRQKERVDDGTVIEALRGWPGHRQSNPSEEEMDVCYFEEEPAPVEKPSAPKKTGGAWKQNNKPKSTKRVTHKEEDVSMGDIMSQRFLNEFAAQRQAEMEREQRKKEANAQAAKDGRRAAKDRTDIKANKAAALRSIALAVKVETSPMDLWKMPKFTRGARPQLSTFRNNRSGGSDGGNVRFAQSGGGDFEGGYGQCTCDNGDECIGTYDDAEEELM